MKVVVFFIFFLLLFFFKIELGISAISGTYKVKTIFGGGL